MSNILLITSSPRGDESVSNKFSGELANKLKAKSASNTLVHRDLAAYAAALAAETGGEVVTPEKLVAPMLARFMASDRGFVRSRHSAKG